MRRTIGAGLERGVFPGVVACVSMNGEPVFYEAHGAAEVTPNHRAMQLDTRFDLAGLTQVVATMPALLRTVQMGKISLVDPVVRYLPEFATGIDRYTKAQINSFHLLTHSSGLPSWKPLFLQARGMKAYLRQLADTPLETAPGTRGIQSDLGYMLLGFLLERVWDRPLSEVCDKLVFQPLGMASTSFAGEGLPVDECAATEIGNEQERRHCDQHDFPWRGNTVCGEVLDGNAFYGLDGVSGHAGLFSTAADLNQFAELWVRKGIVRRERFFDATLVTLSTSAHTNVQGRLFGFGFEVSGDACAIGTAAPNHSFGLAGDTGVSLWCDPMTKTTSVVLTNAIHPETSESRADDLARWRQQFHMRAFQG
ncbi:serine hydrolase [Tumebacillus sp. ITR2]|uniref:Serine hydrolase n=1 Tax=Tumebacillus amylolyticus TaxID=2801339 RepID=A0ABS1J763_9BACL|nr:serine hydrolase [Tumebacillus amylolyticus]MBL0386109.1 serine hydrolase [Tumebacillus amylolyticus]